MKAAILFRSLTPNDEPFLWDMLYQALYVPPGQPAFSREILKEPRIRMYVENWGRSGDMGILALENNHPVGAVWLRLWASAEKGYGYIDSATPEVSIALLPEYRGQGIGSRLMNDLLAAARPDYSALSLSVSSGNPARRLYERLGFEMVRQEGDSLTMVIRLGR